MPRKVHRIKIFRDFRDSLIIIVKSEQKLIIIKLLTLYSVLLEITCSDSRGPIGEIGALI